MIREDTKLFLSSIGLPFGGFLIGMVAYTGNAGLLILGMAMTGYSAYKVYPKLDTDWMEAMN
jgi:hypothetical protein